MDVADGAVVFGLVIVGLIFIGSLFVILYVSSFKKVPPDHAMVVYGRGTDPATGMAIFKGGGKFIVPVLQSYEVMDLGIKDGSAFYKELRTKDGTFLDAEVSFQYRIGDTPKMLEKAATELLRSSGKQKEQYVSVGVEKALREVMRDTESGIIADREPLDDRIRKRANAILNPGGLAVRSFRITEMTVKEKVRIPLERTGGMITAECPLCGGIFDLRA